eukprot:CAMPEP_0170187024 /NCGR_PEP_ID=MMETSP0040_2-20121228/40729_1 /TAXON_ID=641309 /ORGANISM="Lotharella oceanica, Strain CCMP622" /LENGTH=72 /DNA_ID=CAMNT_0010433941 /DNA_START=59 /DNA_END=274 /DNA_ORIENTATION=+
MTSCATADPHRKGMELELAEARVLVSLLLRPPEPQQGHFFPLATPHDLVHAQQSSRLLPEPRRAAGVLVRRR